MFTGIIKKVGRVKTIDRTKDASKLSIITDLTKEINSKVGDSIAVNGICLTITKIMPTGFEVDVMPETTRRTNLGLVQAEGEVNLEPAILPTDRMDGHFVLGHVDTTARVSKVVNDQNSVVLTFETKPKWRRYIVEKGSVAIDGVSLTVSGVEKNHFSVSLIPFTMQETVLGNLDIGSVVNIETDILGKYVLDGERAEND
ncbi:riboflavin synthase [Pediococcus stilesii]|uniref:Riboflavin synthase n=1 Tax=Pediococcus stilesii TaxID=331679 RepID=A0A0R2L8I6_9LACO|nr:riboflavin synthase [Pediococcus stilesii]KRN95031.1 riboflavin synthase subunit alpha [Pediococcus stilesii]